MHDDPQARRHLDLAAAIHLLPLAGKSSSAAQDVTGLGRVVEMQFDTAASS